MISTTTLSQFHGDPFSYPTLYRSIIGSLQYLILTRPDIVLVVNKVYCYFDQDQVASKSLNVKFLSSKDQLADALRIPLPLTHFIFIRHNLNIYELSLNL
ncbi:hypothetical protein Peur_058911 [Populus x canadensis]